MEKQDTKDRMKHSCKQKLKARTVSRPRDTMEGRANEDENHVQDEVTKRGIQKQPADQESLREHRKVINYKGDLEEIVATWPVTTPDGNDEKL